MSDILVKELRDEHRDREWVDTYGYHWIWCEDSWLWWNKPEWGMPGEWIRPLHAAAVNEPRHGMGYGPGPFMEAMHHKLLWEQR